jgi:vitamin B12 transporter
MQSQITANWSFLEITGGVDWTEFKTQDYGYNYAKSPAVTHSDKAGFLIGKLRLFNEKLIVNAGVRYDEYKVELEGFKSATPTNLTPSFGVAFLPLDWVKLRANYAEGFHLPTPNQLTRDVISGGVHYIANPDLDPYTSESFEIGVDVFQDWWDAYVTYFHSKYTGQVRSAATGAFDDNGLPVVEYFNSSQGTTYAGIEFGGKLNIGGLLNWKSYFGPYMKATHFTARRAYREATRAYETDTEIPDWVVAYGLDFDNPDIKFSFNINASYVGRARVQNWSPINRPNVPYQGYFIAPSYTIVDLLFKKEIFSLSDDKHKVTLNLAIRNVLNKYYESRVDYPGPGRNFFVSLRYDYN